MEHKSIVFQVREDGTLKFVAEKSNFEAFRNGVLFNRNEVLMASSPMIGTHSRFQYTVWSPCIDHWFALLAEVVGQRRAEIAALSSPAGKRITQEKKHLARSLSLEKVRKLRQAGAKRMDKSVTITN